MESRACRIGLVAAALLATAAPAARAERNAEAVAKVKAGELTEAKASWWGFDPVDATEALQAAINSGAKRLIVEDMARPWIVRPLDLASDQEIVFEKGAVVEAKKGEFKGTNDSLMRIKLRRNVTLTGHGATLRMQREDYDKPPYKKAEWRHVLDIRSSTNVKVVGLTLADSGGDGIYLGVGKKGVTNKGVHIKDVVCDRNYRQGISVITAEDLLIEDTVMKHTGGTPPMAGIDFEPNDASERVVNCVMRNCVAEDNQGCGYVFYLPNLTGKSAPLSVRFENCIARGANRIPFAFMTGNGHPDGPLAGTAEFVDCTFADGSGPALTIAGQPADGCRLRFVNCRLVNPAKANAATPAIRFQTRSGNTQDMGAVDFENCVLEDTHQRPIMTYGDWGGGLRLVDVTGTLAVRVGGKETVHTFTPKFLEGLQTGIALKRFPRYDMRGVRFEPVSEGLTPEKLAVRPFSLRKRGTFVVYARKGTEVTMTLRHLQVGKYGGKPMPVTAVAPSGKKLRLGEVPFKGEATLGFTAAETGLFRVTCDAGGNKFQMAAANVPACVSGEKGSISFISAVGDYYFHVPAGTKEFGVKVFGQGQGEAVAAAVFDPAGAKVWDKPLITTPEQFTCTPAADQTGKAWKLRFARPTGTTMEDFYLVLEGIPPLLSSTPNGLVRPVQ